MYKLLLTFCVALTAGGVWAQDADTVYYFSPDWSSDGSQIVFESGTDGQLSIFVVDIDGNNLTQLTDTEYNDEGPVWSPDSKEIAFFSNRQQGKDELPISLQIYVMNANGTAQRRVTHEGPALEYKPSWSPDGSQLVFQSRPEIDPGVHSLYVIGADGKGRKRITNGQFDDASPEWSPDGKLLVYSQSIASYKFYRERVEGEGRSIRASADIVVYNIEDGTITPVTQNKFNDFDPSWNADGSEVYYLQNDTQNKTLYRQKLGQKEAIAVANGEVVSNSGVSRTRLSPNGRFLVYNKEISGKHGLYVYDLELKQKRLLVGGPSK
jgi:Tol biopolymer transport system component